MHPRAEDLIGKVTIDGHHRCCSCIIQKATWGVFLGGGILQLKQMFPFPAFISGSAITTCFWFLISLKWNVQDSFRPWAYLASCLFLFQCRERKANTQMPKNLMRNRSGHAGKRFRLPDPKSIALWAERPCLREECISSEAVPQRAGGNAELFRHKNTPEPADCLLCDGSVAGRKMDGFPEKISTWDCVHGSAFVNIKQE